MSAPFGTTVLEHFRRPRNRRPLESPTAVHEAFNPLCGDRVRIELRIVDDIVREAAFTASACAICTASASLLTERVTGLAVAGARAITERDLALSLDTNVPAARARCVALPLDAMRVALAAR